MAYTWQAVLFSDSLSPSRWGMEQPGDVHDEQILLPLDPDLLYQRIGDQCIAGGGFALPYFQCAQVVESIVGSAFTWRSYRKIAFDPVIAETARVGVINNPEGPELDVAIEGLENHRIRYRYFAPGSCAVEESCISGTGWRRLLEFDATVINRGAGDLLIGSAFNGPWVEHNTFFFSPCHQHLHFLFLRRLRLRSARR